jgi:hypothetical protein
MGVGLRDHSEISKKRKREEEYKPVEPSFEPKICDLYP